MELDDDKRRMFLLEAELKMVKELQLKMLLSSRPSWTSKLTQRPPPHKRIPAPSRLPRVYDEIMRLHDIAQQDLTDPGSAASPASRAGAAEQVDPLIQVRQEQRKRMMAASKSLHYINERIEIYLVKREKPFDFISQPLPDLTPSVVNHWAKPGKAGQSRFTRSSRSV
ncbi:Protein of unknown function [Pyronema omphalodes CBS 100304]|uniref:Uncharacterized protein n=1 Tax=Pyronema omphalodes (strain CBS 100304) TaxID=1076935 RepID=U4LKA9_PYROM|nr:Protein of unknown function [Pyronema omphalodes CBS 100304]